MRSWAFLTLCLAAACGGGDNELSGSISESFSLSFDHVALRKQGDAFIVEYLKDTNKVCKLVLDTRNMALGDDTNVGGSTFLARVTLERVASTGGDFPPVKSGKLHFDDYNLTNGGDMQGQFDVVFDNGRTLHGDFFGKVQEVPLD